MEERQQRCEALVGRVLEPVRRYLARRADPATADDVLGEVLLVCWRRLDAVPPEPDDVPWALGVARNALANAERGRRRQTRVAAKVAVLDPPVASVPGPGADVDDQGGDSTLAAALARLPEAQAEVVRLWAWERLEPREIAVVLDTTPNAVSLRLTRARSALRDALASERQDRAAAGHEGAGGGGDG